MNLVFLILQYTKLLFFEMLIIFPKKKHVLYFIICIIILSLNCRYLSKQNQEDDGSQKGRRALLWELDPVPLRPQQTNSPQCLLRSLFFHGSSWSAFWKAGFSQTSVLTYQKFKNSLKKLRWSIKKENQICFLCYLVTLKCELELL